MTAFVDRIRPLYNRFGVSTVLVMSGLGDYVDAADAVIQMTAFTPRDATACSREVARCLLAERAGEGTARLERSHARIPATDGLDPTNAYGRFRNSAGHARPLVYGRSQVDPTDV